MYYKEECVVEKKGVETLRTLYMRISQTRSKVRDMEIRINGELGMEACMSDRGT